MVWRLWSEPPDLVQTDSGNRLDLPALCPEQSGAKPADLLPWDAVGRDLTTAVCYRPGADGPFGRRSGFLHGVACRFD